MESNESRHGKYEIGEEGVTVAVVTAVARAEGVRHFELTPLNDVINPDVLESVVRSEAGDEYRVAFSYCGYRVEVDSSDVVTVTPERD